MSESETVELVEEPAGWKEDKFKPEDNPYGLLAESSFSILYPRYQEQNVREAWPVMQQALKEFNIICDLDAIRAELTVKTTRKTWDPFMILKARDMVKLVSRSVPVSEALKVLQDDMACDIIKVGGMVSKKERFIRRRQRLLGNNGTTLKALEILTKCYILVQGSTVAAIGPHRGLKDVREFVENTMKNIHPVYQIKKLMITRELEKRPELKGQDWSRFYPKYVKSTVSKRSKPKKKTTKKEYTPFPPPQQPSKIDKELESGEYFLKESERSTKKLEKKKTKQQEKLQERATERASAFIAPDENKLKRKLGTTDKTSKKDKAAKLDDSTGLKTSKAPKSPKSDTKLKLDASKSSKASKKSKTPKSFKSPKSIKKQKASKSG